MKNKLFYICIAITACTHVQAQLHKGDSLYALGNYNKAIVAYKVAGNNEIKIANSYQALGNTAKALSYYKQGLDNDNQNLLTQYNYGKLLLKADRYKKADSVFEKLTQLDPKNPEFYYQSGVAKEALNDSTAIVQFMNATKIDKEHQNAHYKLAKHFTTKRHFTQASTHIDIGLKAAPTSIRFINLNALVYFYSKSYHDALKQYEHLLDLNQSNEQLHVNLAISYARTNQFLKAIEQYKIVIAKYDDENPTYHFNLGKMYWAEKKNALAIAHIKQAIALQSVPLDRQYLTLASIYKKEGDYKNTFLMIEKAVAESPNDEMLRYQYAVAADNYYKDEKSVVALYEAYLTRYGADAKYGALAEQRISDIKTKNHFEKQE
ncbi:Tetratricopeptide repeat family protein [unidentified eubacterium SCB49]|nr:Tetratricopeptide repeat family protein [unidentified eubacterium SCB49]